MSLLEEKLTKRAEPALVGRTARAETKDALAGVKVVEFGAYAAGPCISKYLANFGARVVHVESRQRPDGFRLQYPPFKDGQVGLNRSGCFAFWTVYRFRGGRVRRHCGAGRSGSSAADRRGRVHRSFAIRNRGSVHQQRDA